MDRQPPRATSDEIDLYIRTYYSLLRSSGEVRVRGFEESHMYSASSLHEGARDPAPDAAGLDVRRWDRVRTRGRRRPLAWDGGGTLAAFVTSTSDIDDLVPILTAYQIEWNKLYRLIAPSDLGRRIA